MIVSLFIALFLLVGIAALIHGGLVHRQYAPRRDYAYKSQPSRSMPEADNL